MLEPRRWARNPTINGEKPADPEVRRHRADGERAAGELMHQSGHDGTGIHRRRTGLEGNAGNGDLAKPSLFVFGSGCHYRANFRQMVDRE